MNRVLRWSGVLTLVVSLLPIFLHGSQACGKKKNNNSSSSSAGLAAAEQQQQQQSARTKETLITEEERTSRARMRRPGGSASEEDGGGAVMIPGVREEGTSARPGKQERDDGDEASGDGNSGRAIAGKAGSVGASGDGKSGAAGSSSSGKKLVKTWNCSVCGREIGTGDEPPAYTVCPYCRSKFAVAGGAGMDLSDGEGSGGGSSTMRTTIFWVLGVLAAGVISLIVLAQWKNYAAKTRSASQPGGATA